MTGGPPGRTGMAGQPSTCEEVQRLAWGTSVASWPVVLLVPAAGAVVGLLSTHVAPDRSGSEETGAGEVDVEEVG